MISLVDLLFLTKLSYSLLVLYTAESIISWKTGNLNFQYMCNVEKYCLRKNPVLPMLCSRHITHFIIGHQIFCNFLFSCICITYNDWSVLGVICFIYQGNIKSYALFSYNKHRKISFFLYVNLSYSLNWVRYRNIFHRFISC